MSTMTVASLLELARSRHPLFSQSSAPDGSLVAILDARQRTMLLKYRGAVDGLVSTSVQLAAVISGVLVGSDSGVPYFLTTYQDGYAVHSDTGVPYVDFTETPIAGDPFGAHGGTPGFPLPSDFVSLIKVTAVYSDNRVGPVSIIAETARLDRQRSPDPTAFVSGNRLVPVRALTTGNAGDAWGSSIVAVQLSYIAWPRLTALADFVTVPAVLIEPLVAGLAAHLAMVSPGVPVVVQRQFAQLAADAEEQLADYAADIAGPAVTTSVAYKG